MEENTKKYAESLPSVCFVKSYLEQYCLTNKLPFIGLEPEQYHCIDRTEFNYDCEQKVDLIAKYYTGNAGIDVKHTEEKHAANRNFSIKYSYGKYFYGPLQSNNVHLIIGVFDDELKQGIIHPYVALRKTLKDTADYLYSSNTKNKNGISFKTDSESGTDYMLVNINAKDKNGNLIFTELPPARINLEQDSPLFE